MKITFPVLSLVLFTLFFSALVSGQSLEQLQALRNQAQQKSATTGGDSSASTVSPMDLSTDITLPSMSSGTNSVGRYYSQPRQGMSLPGEPTIESVYPSTPQMAAPPYASNLFIGGFESERASGLNEDYLIAPGDKISIWMWGAVNYSGVATVDNQGNIFIPNIGPIHLANAPASSVNSIVQQRIRQVYTDVNIYINLLTSTPVSVFISGPVIRPGQYAGQASDSILYYLRRAGGIDFHRGSFRIIEIKRAGESIQTIDLYQFARHGRLPEHQFKDGDVILVHPIGNTVTVTSGAKNSFTFEFLTEELSGGLLNEFAIPNNAVNHVAISGLRDGEQFAKYLTTKQFESTYLKAGDIVAYSEDHEQNIYKINIAGSFAGQSKFMVEKGTRIHQLLDYIAVNPQTSDADNIYLLRKSVALKQAEIIEESLQRLERSIYTAPISSSGEGAIRVQEAQLVSDFIARAREVEPLGKVIISEDGKLANVLLEHDDTIFIPSATDLVHVGGEVLLPQSVVFNNEADIEDYLAWAGGFTQRADSERILVIKKNGNVKIASLDEGFWFKGESDSTIEAGDQVVVLPSIEVKSLQAIKDITQIIYQIAVAANVALD
ncbi:polysaccharide biosynthesis/export family protein [Alteromonas sp. ASW11-130]|uniref:polysaccharide biosynthesis/export family protein n=1 Tax=Alteromonas sp. ASW11-130 TaxID=3015775 RepID=UPI0022419ED4|nr:polysaccharide biosynthesis/export family protein [Alteromonas sp. ASW11-130]MCW8091695.1 polysaccharide export protein [Alteromonas sp. ASW11-130]